MGGGEEKQIMEQEKTLNISAIQMSSIIGDKYKNFDKLQTLVERDITDNVDVIILPEVWTVGWDCREFRKTAEYIDSSETVALLSDIAKKYKACILGGSFIEKVDEQTFLNTCPVIDREGKLIAKYSKNHLYSSYGADENKYVKTGDCPVMIDIDGIKTGLTICYDIRFPEIFRAYRKLGAELLVNMAAWGLKKPIPWETMTRCRAIENQAYMVALTQSGQISDTEWNIGHSRIFDFLGETISEIKDQKEGAMSVTVNFSKLRKYREECQIMNDLRASYEVKYYETVH